jgi:hypothetical protein
MAMVAVGERYRVNAPFEVAVWLAIAAPVSFFGRGIVPADEVLVVDEPDVYGRVCLLPERYEALHDLFVSAEARAEINRAYGNSYEGYCLLIAQADLAAHCERVDHDA